MDPIARAVLFAIALAAFAPFAGAQDKRPLVHEAVVNGAVDRVWAAFLSYEPMRMLSIRTTSVPQGFPFPNAIRAMWTVIHFESQGAQSTRVREVSMGFGDDEESTRMRAFFDRGNAFTLEQLRKRFAAAGQ